MKIKYSVVVFKEGDSYAAYTPQLDLSSCGDTPTTARRMLGEAIELFLDEAENRGTLEDILKEGGYGKEKNMWISPPLVEIATEETL